jgi:hypothetical protein
MEPILVPGTLILIDGRSNNVHFLRKKFYRKWKYKYIRKLDQHLFELIDSSIGKYNSQVNDFYISK